MSTGDVSHIHKSPNSNHADNSGKHDCVVCGQHFTALSDVISHLNEHSAEELNPDIKSNA